MIFLIGFLVLSSATLTGSIPASKGDIVICGTVTDADDGGVLMGVMVRVLNADGSYTTKGTETDSCGNYLITISPGQQLEFSYFGYRKITKQFMSPAVYDVEMECDFFIWGTL